MIEGITPFRKMILYTMPIITNNYKEAIFKQISMSHVIVIPTGMYATYSKWIQKEIEGSSDFGKPILAVNPWGQERTSNVVTNAAKNTVGWNKQSVIEGIWKLYK